MYDVYRHTFSIYRAVLMNKCQEIPFTVVISVCLTHRYIQSNDINSSRDENQFPVRACKQASSSNSNTQTRLRTHALTRYEHKNARW